MKCMTEIGSLSVGPEYDDKFGLLFSMVMSSVANTLSVDAPLVDIYEDSSDADQNFIQNLALFLCGFLSNHLKVFIYHHL